jgi:hypothetical protein
MAYETQTRLVLDIDKEAEEAVGACRIIFV